MFRIKSIILILSLISCNSVDKKTTPNIPKSTPLEIVNKSDSILIYADKKMSIIKDHQIEQKLYVDSLQHTIEVEQFTINDLNKEVDRRRGVDANLQLTKKELEIALLKCKEKEDELINLKEDFNLKNENYLNERVLLVNFYNNKIDSLITIIDSLKIDVEPIIINNTKNKKNKKRRKP